MIENNKIISGNFDSFTVFQIKELQYTSDYIRLLKKIVKTNLIISAETLEGEISFNEKFEELLNTRQELYKKSKSEGKVLPNQIRGDFTLNNEHGNSELIDEFKTSQIDSLHKLASIYHYEELYTGFDTRDFKNILLLYPAKAVIGDRIIYISVMMYLYKNGVTIFNFSLDGNGLDLNKLSEDIWNIHFDKVFLPEFLFSETSSDEYKKKGRCTSLRDVENVYKDFFSKRFKIQYFSEPFHFLNLINYRTRPNDFREKRNSLLFNKSVYNLLYAPITDFTSKDDDVLDDYLKDRYFSTSNFQRYYINASRIISVNSKKVESEFPIQGEKRKIDDRTLYHSYFGAVFNAIEVVLFKKLINDRYLISQLHEGVSLRELYELKIKINSNSLLEYNRYFYTFGSLRTLTEFALEKSEDFLKSYIVDQRTEKIEVLIKFKRDRNVSALGILGPIVSIILTMLLSFPSLKDIMKYIHKEEYTMTVYIIFNILFSLLLFSIFYKQSIDFIKKKLINGYDKFIYFPIRTIRNILRKFLVKENKTTICYSNFFE